MQCRRYCNVRCCRSPVGRDVCLPSFPLCRLLVRLVDGAMEAAALWDDVLLEGCRGSAYNLGGYFGVG